jgi:hypothetical protein
VFAAFLGIEFVHGTQETKGGEPTGDSVWFDESTKYFLGFGGDDSMEMDGICHGFFFLSVVVF